jgi:hypothetical protein
MNTNLKIALFLGYTFTNHGWISPGRDEDHAFKVMDDMDYDIFSFNDAQSLIEAMNEIEKMYHMEFEFTRENGIYRLLKIHRLENRVENLQNIEAPDFSEFLRMVLKTTPIKEGIDAEVVQVKENYPWHYVGVNKANGKYA